MKTLLLPILLISAFSYGQKCTDFYYMQNNKTIEMSITNKKGKEMGKNTFTISNVSTSGGVTSSVITSEFVDAKGKTLSKATNAMKCNGGVLMMDMKMFIPSGTQSQMGEASATASSVYLEYPSNMKVGDDLKDGQFSMDMKMQSGINGSVSVEITNRKVESRESITTPAGTWDCFKITSHDKIVTKMGIGIPFNTDVTEWYAPHFGIVRSESKGGTTEITSIK